MTVPVERPYLVVTRGGVDLSLEIYLFLEISLLVSSYYSCLLLSEISGVLGWVRLGCGAEALYWAWSYSCLDRAVNKIKAFIADACLLGRQT
jgi:hypothetical protein